MIVVNPPVGPVKVAEAVTKTIVTEASRDDKASVVLEVSSDCWFCCVDGCAVSVSPAPALVVSAVVVPETEAVAAAVTSAVTWSVVMIVV